RAYRAGRAGVVRLAGDQDEADDHGRDHQRQARATTDAGHRTTHPVRWMRAIASDRVAALCMMPRTAEVIVRAPAFLTPRMVMHRCSASITTITPRASRMRISASATWVVSRSCTCGRFA